MAAARSTVSMLGLGSTSVKVSTCATAGPSASSTCRRMPPGGAAGVDSALSPGVTEEAEPEVRTDAVATAHLHHQPRPPGPLRRGLAGRRLPPPAAARA